MAIDRGKSQETKNIIWLTNWRRNAKRKSSKESMTDFYEITNSVSEWLNITEMKKFVDDGMFLQMKITLTTCQKKNTSTTRTNGGSISISRVLTPYYWENVLISSKCCLLWNVYTKKLERNHSCPLIPTSTNNGSRHRVRPLHGGNGKIPGGLLKKSESQGRGKQSLWNERWDPLLTLLWRRPPKMAFKSSIYFVTDRQFTADGGLL